MIVQCAKCQSSFNIKDSLRGKKLRCSKCQAIIDTNLCEVKEEQPKAPDQGLIQIQDKIDEHDFDIASVQERMDGLEKRLEDVGGGGGVSEQDLSDILNDISELKEAKTQILTELQQVTETVGSLSEKVEALSSAEKPAVEALSEEALILQKQNEGKLNTLAEMVAELSAKVSSMSTPVQTETVEKQESPSVPDAAPAENLEPVSEAIQESDIDPPSQEESSDMDEDVQASVEPVEEPDERDSAVMDAEVEPAEEAEDDLGEPETEDEKAPEAQETEKVMDEDADEEPEFETDEEPEFDAEEEPELEADEEPEVEETAEVVDEAEDEEQEEPVEDPESEEAAEVVDEAEDEEPEDPEEEEISDDDIEEEDDEEIEDIEDEDEAEESEDEGEKKKKLPSTTRTSRIQKAKEKKKGFFGGLFGKK